MLHYSADALVLRTYRYGEADRIVVFLTEDRGKKRGVAKHASVSRRRFGGALEPLTRGRATYVERETRDLVWLDRVETQDSPVNAVIGRGGESATHVLGHASYFAELLDEWAPDGSPNARLFRLGAAVGAALSTDGSIDALARYFEFWLLRLEGVYPPLDRCPRCRRATFARGAVLDVADRLYVCRDCAQGGIGLSPEALEFLNRAQRDTPAGTMQAAGGTGGLRELEQAHQALIGAHLERDLRSTRVVKELRAES
jgi:DNA repair protein RecO (recombination protein O)